METIKYTLTEDQMPTAWYNIQADLPTPLPPVLHPGTGQPITPRSPPTEVGATQLKCAFAH